MAFFRNGDTRSDHGIIHHVVTLSAPTKRNKKPVMLAALACALLMAYMNGMLTDNDGRAEYEESMSRFRMLAEEGEAAEDVNPNDGPTFVFIMGIEGTGHHLLEALLGQSPNMKKMTELGSCGDGGELEALSNQFFGMYRRRGTGLYNPDDGKKSKKQVDAVRLFDTTVGLLKSMRDKYKEDVRKNADGSEPSSSLSLPFNIPINANGCPADSMISYPTFMGPDRPLQNFNLDVFYNACSQAKVNCEHVYIYRDPYDVIKSTLWNRRYNKDVYDSIRLYTSVTQNVHSQMVSYPERIMGCFGFLDPKGAQIEQDWERFGKLFGWDKESFVEVVKELNSKGAPEVMADEMKERLIPARLGPLMTAFEQVHYRVVDYCYSLVAEGVGEETEHHIVEGDRKSVV